MLANAWAASGEELVGQPRAPHLPCVPRAALKTVSTLRYNRKRRVNQVLISNALPKFQRRFLLHNEQHRTALAWTATTHESRQHEAETEQLLPAKTAHEGKLHPHDVIVEDGYVNVT